MHKYRVLHVLNNFMHIQNLAKQEGDSSTAQKAVRMQAVFFSAKMICHKLCSDKVFRLCEIEGGQLALIYQGILYCILYMGGA